MITDTKSAKKSHGTQCDNHDECLSGICHYKSVFYPDFQGYGQKFCLEEPTEWHTCETTSDCESLPNPFLNDQEHWMKDYFIDRGILHAEEIEAKARAYPEPTIQLFCGTADMISSNDFDISDSIYNSDYDDFLRSNRATFVDVMFDDVNSPGLDHKICYVPLDLYRATTLSRQQFIACKEDNHCWSKKCDVIKGICLRPDLEECFTNDQCISGHCARVSDNLGNRCLPSEVQP